MSVPNQKNPAYLVQGKNVLLYVFPLRGDQQVGDVVEDITAAENGWEDRFGVVQEVDGSHVKVKYDSGTERWKMHINVRKILKADSVESFAEYHCASCKQSHAVEGIHSMPTHECPYCGYPASKVE